MLFSPSFQMFGHTLRLRGLRSQLEEEYPHIQLTEIYELTGDDIQDYQLSCQALDMHPDTNLFVCPGAYSYGNLKAIADKGYLKRAGIVCYDYSEKISSLTQNRDIQVALTQCPQEQGYLAIRILFDYLSASKKPAFRDNYVHMRILLKENISEIQQLRKEYHQI